MRRIPLLILLILFPFLAPVRAGAQGVLEVAVDTPAPSLGSWICPSIRARAARDSRASVTAGLSLG